MTPLAHHLIGGGGVHRDRRRCSGATSRTIGRLAVVMLVVVLVTVGWVIVAGLFTFSPAQAFDFPAGGVHVRSQTCSMSVGAASVLAMYSYGGYNQVCNIGEEIRDPDPHHSAIDRAVDRSSSPRSTS